MSTHIFKYRYLSILTTCVRGVLVCDSEILAEYWVLMSEHLCLRCYKFVTHLNCHPPFICDTCNWITICFSHLSSSNTFLLIDIFALFQVAFVYGHVFKLPYNRWPPGSPSAFIQLSECSSSSSKILGKIFHYIFIDASLLILPFCQMK